jgi:HEAT repeat protein
VIYNEENWWVRTAAAVALGHLGEQAYEWLIGALDGKN